VKRECEQTRQAFSRYLNGHLFRTSRTRVERHLRECVMCRTEYEALRRAEETRQILRDMNAPDGVVGKMKEGLFAIGRLKKIVYRPLWIAGIVLTVAAVYYYMVTPRQLDLEIENIVKTAPTVSEPAATSAGPHESQPGNTAPLAAPPAVVQPPSPASPLAAAPLPEPAPLVVTITPENDNAAVSRINEVMHDHGQLRKMTFSETVKELSGRLTARELLTFFNRIEPAAKVSYSRKRLESFPAARPLPFVLRLKAAPKAVEKPPEEDAAPAPPATTAPAPSAAQ
jgi:hypothetical protein